MRSITTAAAVLGLLAASPLAASQVIYETSFENDGTADAVAPGTYNAPASLGTWSLTSGTAVVGAGDTPDGSAQLVTLSAGAQLDRAFGPDITGQIGDIVFVEGFSRTAGSSLQLQNAVYPAGESVSAIVHFSQTAGIQLLNGDRAGGAGTIIDTEFDLGPGRSGDWHRITVKLDFATQDYDVHIRRLPEPGYVSYTGLGFRDNVSSLNGFRNMAEGALDFDAFRVVLPFAGDANGDGVIDVADVVRVAEYIRNGADDPILAFNADLTSTGAVGNEDLSILVDLVAGGPTSTP